MKAPLYSYLEPLEQAPRLRFSSSCSALQTQGLELGYFYKTAAAPFGVGQAKPPSSLSSAPMGTYFQLYPHSQVVRGKPQALLCHLQSGYWREIPELLADVLEQNQGRSIAETQAAFQHQLDAGIERYFQHLQQEAWGFFSETLSHWQPLTWRWDYPGALSNAILERNASSRYPLLKALEELLSLGIGQLQLWLEEADWPLIFEVLATLQDSALRQIEIYLPYSDTCLEQARQALLRQNRLRGLHFFNAPEETALFQEHPALRHRAWSHAQPFPDKAALEKPFFWCNLPAYAEAQQALVGLHRLLSIDAEGAVKYFPSHDKILGHFPQRSLSAIWAKQKPLPQVEEIQPCRTCSYRYICQAKQLPQQVEGMWRRSCGVPQGRW